MKKTIISIIICLLLTTSITSVNASYIIEKTGEFEISEHYFHTIPFADIYVDDDAPPGGNGSYEHPYQFILDGIAAASDGDTVFVFSGAYNEYLKFNKSIKLIGENKETTFLNSLTSGIEVSDVDGLLVSRFCLNESVGIHMYRTYNSTISNNLLNKCEICLSNSSYNTIYNNIFSRSPADGVCLWYKSEYNVIKYNKFINCDPAVTVRVGNNTVINNEMIGSGIDINHDSNIIVSDNIIEDISDDIGAIGIRVNWCNNAVITGNIIRNLTAGLGATGIDICWSENTIVKDNSITDLNSENCAKGIGLSIDSHCTIIEDNIITDIYGKRSSYGIEISDSCYSTIYNNNIFDIQSLGISDGISIQFLSDNNEIIGNNIKNCSYSCIFLSESEYNTIKENTLLGRWPTADSFGICFGGFVKHSTISKNTISKNSRGMYLSLGCMNNMISKNTFEDNGEGIGLGRGNNNIGSASSNSIIANEIKDAAGYGINCEIGSYNNEIYYNNLINNSQNAKDEGINIWYKFKLLGKNMGNYWDDYNGADNNGDGIGDTPYIIEGKKIFPSKDNYPVMEPIDIEDIEVTAITAQMVNVLKVLQSNPNSQPIGQLNSQQTLLISILSNSPTNR